MRIRVICRSNHYGIPRINNIVPRILGYIRSYLHANACAFTLVTYVFVDLGQSKVEFRLIKQMRSAQLLKLFTSTCIGNFKLDLAQMYKES